MTDGPEGKPIEHSGRIISAEIRTKATPQQAYDAWADPEKIAHWFPDRAEGKAEPSATITWIFDKFNYRIPYEVLIAQPAEKFAIRWNPPPGMNPGILEVTISKEGGETVGFLGNADWETSYGWGFMLLSLQVALERHPGTARQVAWPRLKVTLSREDAYRKLLTAGALFSEDLQAALKPGEEYSLTTTTGESYTGRVAFVRDQRGFCLTIRELNDALLWLTIEGAPGQIEVQAWLSAFSVDPPKVEDFGKKWRQRLQEIFQN